MLLVLADLAAVASVLMSKRQAVLCAVCLPHLQRLGVGEAVGYSTEPQQHSQALQHPAQLPLQHTVHRHKQDTNLVRMLLHTALS